MMTNEPTIRQVRANNTPDPVWAEAVSQSLADAAERDDKMERARAASVAQQIRLAMATTGPVERQTRDGMARTTFGLLWWVRACREAELDGTR